MMKKMISALAALVVVLSVSLQPLAAHDLVTITRPNGDETTSKKTFTICGYSAEDNVEIRMFIVDNDDDTKVAKLLTVEDEESFMIGDSGTFRREVPLKNGTKGGTVNKIRLVATDKDTGETQEVNLKVTAMSETLKDFLMKVKGWLEFK